MARLNPRQLDVLRRTDASVSDKRLARKLGVAVALVRRARKELRRNQSGGQPTSTVADRPGSVGRLLLAAGGAVDHAALVWPLMIALLAVILYALMLPISNPDFGWHAALGRYMVDTGGIATTEPLSHTARGVPMVAHEWLAQVVYYVVIQVVGVLGVRWIHAAIPVGAMLAIYFLLRRVCVARALALTGAFVYFLIAQHRFQVRPHMFDLVFLITLYAYLFVLKPELNRRQLITLFVTMVVWVNVHSGAVLITTLIVIYTVVEVVQQKLGWSKPEPDGLGRGEIKRLITLAAGSAVALVLTPNHFRLFPYIVESKRVNSVYSEEWASVIDYLGETVKPYAAEMYCVLLGATLLAAIVVLRQRGSLSELAVVLFLALLPLTGQRFVAGCFAPVLFTFSALSRRSTGKTGDGLSWVRSLSSAVASILGAVVVLSLAYPVLSSSILKVVDGERRWTFKNRLSSEWNFRVADFPVGAVKFLEETHLEGNLFHPMEWGGYLAWRLPKTPIFMDGRWITFGQEIFHDDRAIERKGQGAFSLLNKYEINILMIYRDWMTAEDLAKHGWVTVFENFSAGVYIRAGQRGVANLQRCVNFYDSQNVPFDVYTGFNERAAYEANREWANDYEIRRTHLGRPGPRQEQGQVRGW